MQADQAASKNLVQRFASRVLGAKTFRNSVTKRLSLNVTGTGDTLESFLDAANVVRCSLAIGDSNIQRLALLESHSLQSLFIQPIRLSASCLPSASLTMIAAVATVELVVHLAGCDPEAVSGFLAPLSSCSSLRRLQLVGLPLQLAAASSTTFSQRIAVLHQLQTLAISFDEALSPPVVDGVVDAAYQLSNLTALSVIGGAVSTICRDPCGWLHEPLHLWTISGTHPN